MDAIRNPELRPWNPLKVVSFVPLCIDSELVWGYRNNDFFPGLLLEDISKVSEGEFRKEHFHVDESNVVCRSDILFGDAVDYESGDSGAII